jgi:methylphosphotriester-DNA--protein-cysteine methyltransferase
MDPGWRQGRRAVDSPIAAPVHGSEAALTRAFKARFGVTPGAFRRS